MQSKCDILILTAQFGTGHVSVSHALKEHIKAQDEQLIIRVADLYEVMRPRAYRRIYRSYEWMVRYIPALYNKYYYAKEAYSFLRKMDTASRSNLKGLTQYLDKVQPKLVISTFPLCTGYMAKYKEQSKSKIPLVTCITDVVSSKEWIYEGNDCYCVADEGIRQELLNPVLYNPEKGVQAVTATAIVTGIPIRQKFLSHGDQEQIRKRLGYSKEDRILLMMGGGFGLLPENNDFYIWLNQLDQVKVVVLTGKNKKVYKKLAQMKLENVQPIEHTEHVADYMKIAHLLIGKAGGITLFEAIASCLPIIVYKPALGQEIENCGFILDKGIGMVIKTQEMLESTLSELLQGSGKREKMIKQLQIVKSDIHMDLLGETITALYHHKKILYNKVR